MMNGAIAFMNTISTLVMLRALLNFKQLLKEKADQEIGKSKNSIALFVLHLTLAGLNLVMQIVYIVIILISVTIPIESNQVF